jgi:DNA-binding IclR family transcriptional regulator
LPKVVNQPSPVASTSDQHRDASRVLAGRQPAAVDHAFAVLEAVARLGPQTTPQILVERLGLSRASVYRIVKHMVAHGYLEPAPGAPGYVLGARVRELSHLAALNRNNGEIGEQAPNDLMGNARAVRETSPSGKRL